ncbi:hypothetical protein BEN44_17810 [Leptospira interrogans serovar Ricardi]|nr:hypothetical protein [Leptospira interrogans serovar Ricardi]
MRVCILYLPLFSLPVGPYSFFDYLVGGEIANDKEAAQVVSIKKLLPQKAIGFEMLRFYLDENAN